MKYYLNKQVKDDQGDSIVFFGSGPVAASSLQLLAKWQNVVAVITKNKPKHHKETAPVQELTTSLGIPCFYADTKKQLDELFGTKQIPLTKLGIVIDYGVIISQQVIDSFKLGIVNSHFSILPQWRGADPITYSLLSGQKTSGVSVMLIDSGLDTGPLLATKELEISSKDNNISLTKGLVILSDSLLKSTLSHYAKGVIQSKPQQNTIATYSQKLNKKSGLLSPNKTATQTEREVRAFLGWPNSRLNYNGLWLTITQAKVSEQHIEPGKLAINDDNQLLYGCKDTAINILAVKPAGKKEMPAAAFINGYRHLIAP